MKRIISTTVLSLSLMTAAVLSSPSAIAGGDLEQPYIWSGTYAGLSAGYIGETNFDGVFDNGDQPSGGKSERIFLNDFDVKGASVGFHIGHNWQRGNLVFGIEADISKTHLSDKLYDEERDAPTNDPIEGQDSASVNVKSLASLRARIGYANDSILVYATGGLAWANASYTAFDSASTNESQPEDNPNAPDTPNSGTVDFDKIGYVAGAGLEKAYSGLRIRLEGLYYGFNDEVNTSDLTTDSDRGDFAKFEDVITIRAGVSVPLN